MLQSFRIFIVFVTSAAAFLACAQVQASESGSKSAEAPMADAAHVPAGGAHGEVEQADADASSAPADHVGATAGDGGIHGNQDVQDLEPYKLVRSLQFVQDTVVQGDHSAMEIQRFLLGVIDERLRTADQKTFDDPRNVDAALIYAMSGGNPETLDLLAVQDKFGRFDSEITTVLRAYLNGQAARTRASLAEIVEVYRDNEMGPYLALVAANVGAAQNDISSLKFFDWARLSAPGTLVEEAALRRSLFIASREGLTDKAVFYASQYARRFIHSPYAGQYADLLVDLVVGHYEDVGETTLSEIVSFMEEPQKREVYLRIARQAVIAGKMELAVSAASRAEALVDVTDPMPGALADLYSGMAKIPSSGVDQAMKSIAAVSASGLSSRDRALREAAQIVAAEVLRKPDPNSLTQAFSPRMEIKDEMATDMADGVGDLARRADTEAVKAMDASAEAAPQDGSPGQPAPADPAFQGYVERQRKALEDIDNLLKGQSGESGT